MDNKVRTKSSKQHIYISLICLALFLILLFGYSFFIDSYPEPSNTYFEYFLNYRLPDFITQLTLMILSVIYFIKSRNLAGRARIIITTSVWCFVWALASLAWSFLAYIQYPFNNEIFWIRYVLPGLLSSLVLFGTSIFFFITRNYPEEKLLRPKFVKKASLINPKIDSETRKNMLENVSTSNLKDLIHSLTCVKCGSTAKLSFYPVINKSSSRKAERDPNYTFNIFDAPVCDPCRGLYDSWYFIQRKSNRHTLRTIFNIIFILLFLPMIYFTIFFLFLPLVGVIILIVSIVKRTQSFSNQNSPYKNVKLKWGNIVRVRPDNFKKWTSLQDWVLYNLKAKESGELNLTEIEVTLLNYLNENKGSAFSPRALVKRAIGENFTEEYVEVINKLLKKMAQKGIIDTNYHDEKPHYFSN